MAIQDDPKLLDIMSDDEEKLVYLEILLAEATESMKFYQERIKRAMMEPETEAMTFKDAGEDWIHSVTGVDTSFRRWASFVIDETIQPRPGFQTAFEEISNGYWRSWIIVAK